MIVSLIITSLLLIILLQSVELYLDLYASTLEIRLTLFTLSLSNQKNKKSPPKVKYIKILPPLIKAFNYLLRKSEVAVFENAITPFDLSFQGSIFGIGKFLTIYSILSYLKAGAKSFSVTTISPPFSFEEKRTIQISVKVRLIFTIISSFIFLYYLIVYKVRKGIKNVG